MKEVTELKEISKYAGERFDLVQAGGGNTSVKLESGEMLIKASGYSLSDVNEGNGYSKVFTKQVAGIVKEDAIISEEDKRKRESLTAERVKEATIDKDNRPSIETLLHSLLLKYTLHTHPVVANIILIQKNWKSLLQEIFEGDTIVLVKYETPGIDLAIEMDREISKHDEIPKIIFLQNHGLIITADNQSDIYRLNEYVLTKIEDHLKVDFSRYKKSTQLSSLIRELSPELAGNLVSYYSEDVQINKLVEQNKTLFSMTPFCPDSLVYCGISAVLLENINDKEPIKEYLNKYSELPKVVIIGNQLFILSSNIKKAKDIEEVLKFNSMILLNNSNEINHLKFSELAYLGNWEAEKFRQNL